MRLASGILVLLTLVVAGLLIPSRERAKARRLREALHTSHHDVAGTSLAPKLPKGFAWTLGQEDESGLRAAEVVRYDLVTGKPLPPIEWHQMTIVDVPPSTTAAEVTDDQLMSKFAEIEKSQKAVLRELKAIRDSQRRICGGAAKP